MFQQLIGGQRQGDLIPNIYFDSKNYKCNALDMFNIELTL